MDQGVVLYCERCGGREFDVWDGLYFCKVCNTQNQSVVEELFIHDATDMTFHMLGNRVNRKRPAKENKVEPSFHWALLDAFNIILQNQVEALLDLGVSPRLKVVVFNLFVKYLRKLHVFDGKVTDIPMQMYSNRFKRVGKRSAAVKKEKNTTGVPTDPDSTVITVDDSVDGCFNFSGNVDADFQESLTDFGYLQSDMSQQSVDCKKKEKEMTPFYKHLLQLNLIDEDEKNDHTFKKVPNLRLSNSIPFLYLGIILIREQVLLSDLLRWLNDDVVPLHSVVERVLPNRFSLSKHDVTSFQSMLALDCSLVVHQTQMLGQFLNIGCIPKRPIEEIISRLILELGLPSLFIGTVNQLVYQIRICKSKYKATTQAASVINYEAVAMAYIIISLKIMLGLDGKTEWLMSEIAGEWNKVQGKKSSKVFNWKDWCRHLNSKLQLKKSLVPECLRRPTERHHVNVDILSKFVMQESVFYRAARQNSRNVCVPELLDALNFPFGAFRNHCKVDCVPTSELISDGHCGLRIRSSLKNDDLPSNTVIASYSRKRHIKRPWSGYKSEKMRKSSNCYTFSWLLDVLEAELFLKRESVLIEIGKLERKTVLTRDIFN